MSCVRGESAANERRGEGVFIAAHQKLDVAEVLCVCRNFQHRVGTSDTGLELPTSSNSHG